MKKFLQKIRNYFRSREELCQEVVYLQAFNHSLQNALTLMDDLQQRVRQEHIRLMAAVCIQNGGEFLLDQTCIELVDENTTLHVDQADPQNPMDKSLLYRVSSNAPLLGNDVDLPEDNHPCCPDSANCNGGCSN